jgi:hypothetical protein
MKLPTILVLAISAAVLVSAEEKGGANRNTKSAQSTPSVSQETINLEVTGMV